MKFSEVVTQTLAWLQREGRVSYRALCLEFDLTEDMLDALKEELIEVKELAVDKDGKMLVWTGTPSEQPAQNAERAKAEAPKPRGTLPVEAERRQLTVMFCDLVDSTALSAQLDPEDLREVVRAYHETCAGAISRYAGHTAQHLGDGLLVYFGYPAAHEDDAQRAVRTGLEILAGLQSLNARLQSTLRSRLPHPIQVRIGVHTGLVVVGEIGSSEKHEILALGETPNLAARLQGLAAPDTVVISAATHRLIEGLLNCRDLGAHTVKGVSMPLQVYQVVGESGMQSRFEVAIGRGLTPLVGREEELALLQRRWEQAKAGEGQVVLLSGEAGIGKSRLVQTLKEQVTAEGATRIEFRCSPYHHNSAFYPIIDHLQRFLQFAPHDTPPAKLTKLQQTLASYRFLQADTLPLLASLLSLPHPEGAPSLTLSPQKQKQKTQEALVAWIIEDTEKAAVYCAWEDLHWADSSTLEVLTLFLDQVPTTRLLALLTFRPEFMPPWGNRSHLSQMTLSRLEHSQVEAMVVRVAGGKALPPEVVQQIVAKTDGVPLFVEELTKTVVESIESLGSIGSVGATGRSPLHLGIPVTLQDALTARLDRLGPAKEIAQLGSTIGREFSYELLQAVCLLDEATLQHRLKQLVEVELVYQRGLVPQVYYLFKHVLIQDTAYQSLLKSRRQQYHQQIAQVLEERFPETKETQPELLAHHYTEAGLIAQAIRYWQRAGERAIQRSAYVDSISHLSRELELLKALPDTPQRAQQELTLQIALGGSLIATQGLAAPEVESTYTRARELCRQIGETPQLFPVLYGLLQFYLGRGDLSTMSELSAQLLRLAHHQQDPALLIGAHGAQGYALVLQGEFVSARAHLEQGHVLYDPRQRHVLIGGYGVDPGIVQLLSLILALCYLGYPEQALQRVHEVLTLIQELTDPFSQAQAQSFIAMTYQFRREPQATQEHAEAAVALSTEQGFAVMVATGTVLRGWALAAQGQGKEGIRQIYKGLDIFQATGTEMPRPYLLTLLAEAYSRAGQAQQGLTRLSEAQALVDNRGVRYYEAEIHRLKGELTLQAHAHDAQVKSEVERHFLKAIEIARKQHAKSLELRAVMSLARLWQQQGKQEEARTMLAEIYGWFTEGLDTKDLQEAKALLAELSH